MILKIRFLQLAFLCLLACLAAIKPTPVHAQGQTIYCASDDGRRNYCSANTNGGVRLTNQRSGSPCIQGQTWGFDRNQIWVDRGCRAEFTVANGGNWGGGGNPGSGTIYCASDDGRRNYCNANTRGGVRLVNQRSGSPCTQGQTWGWDNSRIWVDRGCRAEFAVGNGGNWGGGGGNPGSGTIYCASDDGRRNYCNANTRGGVRLVNQRSGSPCTQGQTWGWDNNRIWVDRGCRAEFTTGNGGGWSGGGGGPSVGQTFTCSSNDGKQNYCAVPGGGSNVVLSRQISGSPCTQGQTWGLDRRGVWVDRGCRAEFRTTY